MGMKQTLQALSNAWRVFETEGLKSFLTRTRLKLRKILKGDRTNAFRAEIARYAKLAPPGPLDFKTVSQPEVSIIIPVHNQSSYTYNCLKSLHQRTTDKIPFEIIVIDDASTDDTTEVLQAIAGIRVLRNTTNLGFIQSCNRGIEEARADWVCFLNNDTQILPGWLEALVQTMRSHSNIGAVGSKLIYADGRLQEAGGIIWQDATGCNYGRLNSPQEPQYNYLRPVDYCSAASLLVRADLLADLGGFSTDFLPAYYEDTDLCFALRDRGYDVLYQPQSQLIHYEGVTCGIDETSGVKQHQTINRDKFQHKWQTALQHHCHSQRDGAVLGARRLCARPIILVIDSYVPAYDRESGSCRLFHILKLLLELGCTPIFLPNNGLPAEPYTSELQQMGIEVLYTTPNQPDLQLQLRDRLPMLDLAWVCRPQLCEKYFDLLRSRPDLPAIYDTIDLHFLRMQRQEDYMKSNDGDLSWQQMKELELGYARAADATVVVTDVEQKLLAELGIDRVRVVPNIHISYAGTLPEFDARSGLLFIGGYNHQPNVDAVVWLCQEIMPLVWAEDPEMTVTLLGSNPPDGVRELGGDRVIVTGYLADVDPYFLQARLFVAPLRFGAGMKGKIGHSLSYGLPVVTTSIGSEGMGLVAGTDAIVCDEPGVFAKEVLSLYGDRDRWTKMSAQSLRTIQRFGPEGLKGSLQSLVSELQSISTPVR